MKFTINDKIIVYPNKAGWEYIKKATAKGMTSDVSIDDWINSVKTEDGGFKEQFHFIMTYYADLFSQGTDYLKDFDIIIVE